MLIVFLRLNGKQSFIGTLIQTTLAFSVLVFLVTETLSLFNKLNLISLCLSWGAIFFFLIVLLAKDKTKTISTGNAIKVKLSFYFKSLPVKEKLILGVVVLFVFLLCIQGIIYPPNNWDSLTYHMSRIMYWLGNESVAFFPTHIIRELYQPPLTEYYILNINVLNGNDYLANSVQLFFLIQILFVVYALLGFLGISRFWKLLALLLIITIPAVELQSTTTKNDIVCAFYILATIYFGIKIVQSNSLRDYFFIGLAIGLGLLTKGTAYLFLAPVLLCFAVIQLYKIIVRKEFKIIPYNLFLIVIIIALNVTHYSRNYAVNHSILNIDDAEAKAFTNEVMDGKFLFSNLIKNAGLHLGFPIDKPSDDFIRKIHKSINVSIDDKRLNYYGQAYEGARGGTTNEDYVPNTLAFLLSSLSFFVILIHFFKNSHQDKKPLLLISVLSLQILFFAGYLKWQPWHTRLHIPIFILATISIILAVQVSKWYRKVVLICVPILVFSFLYYYIFNNLRPIIQNHKYTKNISITDNRFKKYFPNQPQLYLEYSDILNILYTVNPSKVGLNLNDWEYPLFNSFYYDHIKIVAINVNNSTKEIPQNTDNIDVIISNYNNPVIVYNGMTYSNQNNNHSYIWCYKKTSL